ncbi:receptor y region transmembrane domain- and RING domain-containing protein 2 [Tripterygium wilfordii]|uniref:Receptor y region transmembrane domain- and RING domain-containing protein 2 n=1 Tax=Tripterygium wilfordii TaxID=458696 RepID=A0A7J7BUS3_TRIWF|nr:receptor homology region, transmembrane domain- and RING domain-containing protein 2-like [Tripterygium wilfordii]KAF5725629.1 receptor y region transmembrane domain- and RING domain-containing protein 2 [Tripterygium wilfordii]
MRSVSFVFVVFLFAHRLWMVSGTVVLIGNNVTLSFDDIEANFSPLVQGSGECGVLHLAEPLDACSELTNKVERVLNTSLPFVLIVRGGGCSFEDKVRKAQKAGFKAAIVYDNEDDGVLVSMAGNPAGVKIHAVFVSRASGQILKNYAGLPDMELWIIPSFGNSAWSIMAISFISLLAMSAVLATCFFVRRHQTRQDSRERPQASRAREFHGMSSRLVKAMPSQIFASVVEDNCTSMTCAICLEDYSVGERLRILPCRHKFHAFCVDSWLTSWRTFCPVCKRDARTAMGDPPASESTPLLSSSAASVASSALSSFRSSLASSSAIQILPASSVPASSMPLSVPRTHSLASTPYAQQSLRSYPQSPSVSVSRSSVDLRNASSQRSQYAHFVSPHSSGYPSLIPTSSRYISPYIRSPSYASPSLISSSGYQPNPLRCSDSAASFSPFASAHSLPES